MEGDTVTAYGKLQHQGGTFHEWQIDVKDTLGNLVSTVHVTNYVMATLKKDKPESASKD